MDFYIFIQFSFMQYYCKNKNKKFKIPRIILFNAYSLTVFECQFNYDLYGIKSWNTEVVLLKDDFCVNRGRTSYFQ